MECLQIKQVQLEQLMPLIRATLAEGRSVRFSPMGISMLPMLREGVDSVVLSPVPARLRKYDLPLYRRDNGKYVLHRVVRVGETYTCVGDNQFVLEPGLRQDQMIAVVTAFVRGGREIPVTAAGYRIYCRLWHCSRPVRHFWRRAKGKIARMMKR